MLRLRNRLTSGTFRKAAKRMTTKNDETTASKPTLTVREYFAIRIMSSIMSNPAIMDSRTFSYKGPIEKVVNRSVEMADDLIKQLEA